MDQRPPADDIPPSRAASVEGLVFDIDDTVTRGGRLEREAFDAMWELAYRGIRLVAVTGRPLGWCDVIVRHWPVDLAVGENGAGWVAMRNGRVEEGYFHSGPEREQQRRLLERIRREVGERRPDARVANDQRARRCDLAFDIGEHARLSQQQTDSLVEIIESLGARATVSSVHVHVVPGAWDKAQGVVLAARRALGIELHGDGTRLQRWCFIGDSRNDEAAFAYFPLSVGVRNIEAHLHRLAAAPGWVTHDDRGRGFAELAAALLRAREGTAAGSKPSSS